MLALKRLLVTITGEFCMIVKNESVDLETMSEGIERKILARGGKIMSVEVHFKKGAQAAVHTHPHEQIGYVIKGSLELEIEGKKQILMSGDSFYVSPNIPHGVIALEETTALDVFTPQREDFMRKMR
jgi:quercetin dioxygenase-like cupin family protein